jgi:hypothetical protein
VGKVDEVHDAEDQRQSRREQEQQQPELQSIQDLFDEKQHESTRNEAKAAARDAPPLFLSKIRAHFIGHLSWKRS